MGAICSVKRQVKGATQQIQESEEVSDDIRDLYVIGSVLGSGAFGEVRDCSLKKPKTDEPHVIRAVKIMENKDNDRGDWSNSAMFRREIAVLSKLDHAYIIKYFDFFEDEHFLYAVMEKCEGGELFDQICKRRRFTEEDAAVLCRQMLSALEYVHDMGVVHRDVKAENFLFKNKLANSPVKMIDFGMSARVVDGQKLTEVCGSPHYLAPELLRKSYDSQADMWALGVLIYLMLYGRYPFDGKETKEIVREIIHKKIDSLFEKQKFIYSAAATDFIRCLLNRDPAARLTAKQALLHPWVAHLRTAAEEEEETKKKEEELQQQIQQQSQQEEPIIMHAVRNAQRKVTLARQAAKPAITALSAERRAQLLSQLDSAYHDGQKKSLRISADGLKTNKANTRGDIEVDSRADYRARPEYSRHDKRMSTTPSRLQGHDNLALELAALQVAMEDGEEAQRLIEEQRQKFDVYEQQQYATNGDVMAFNGVGVPNLGNLNNIDKRGQFLTHQQQFQSNDDVRHLDSPVASPFNGDKTNRVSHALMMGDRNNLHSPTTHNDSDQSSVNNLHFKLNNDHTFTSPINTHPALHINIQPHHQQQSSSPVDGPNTTTNANGSLTSTTRKSKRAFTTHVQGNQQME
eukprot:GDKK01056343.1.p1 GENE.GDKK01056343.1~~GDKK01056343.1.p1  ORF type:complete len:639 (+),score=161.21 GDKK01056343.1:25-1917(+)